MIIKETCPCGASREINDDSMVSLNIQIRDFRTQHFECRWEAKEYLIEKKKKMRNSE